MSTEQRAEESYVTDLLARALYLDWCEYKQVDPRPWPYTNPGFRQYANKSLHYTGWDEHTIQTLERDVL